MRSPVDPKAEAGQRQSHAQRLERAGEAVVLPPVTARYLIDYLFDLDWSVSTGMGVGPLPCAEIQAWQRGTDTPLEPWEFKALRAGSLAYVQQLHSESDDPPYTEQPHGRPPVAGAFKALAKRLNKAK